MKDNEKQILSRAIKKFGVTSQFQKCREECCELAVALDRLNNDRPGAMENVIEEVADVYITLEQVRIIIEAVMPQAVSLQVVAKMGRLQGILDE